MSSTLPAATKNAACPKNNNKEASDRFMAFSYQRRRRAAKISSLKSFADLIPGEEKERLDEHLEKKKNTSRCQGKLFLKPHRKQATHTINTPHTVSVELLLASLLILLCQGYEHLEGLYAFLISHVFFLVHRLSFLSRKVQIILRCCFFKSRLHIQYIVHGFSALSSASIGYYLHYSVTFHFIERKSIIHCTNVDGCFQASI